MHHFGFRPNDLPSPASDQRAALGLERWHDSTARLEEAEIAAAARRMAEDADGRRLLESLFGNSPYLTQCAVRDPGVMVGIFSRGPDAVVAGVLDGLEATPGEGLGSSAVASHLRAAKRHVALAVAVADITGVWPLERITGALSGFAEAALGRVAATLLGEMAATGIITLADPGDPERDSGLVVLGMGKLGARELNYSSDIDLVILYDHEHMRAGKPDELHNHMVRLARNLVRLMEERTAEGYVFRTDLRLRPDPGSTPPAISVLAAETYYESLGQNWERAAMIKARPVAGDLECGARFLESLKPFIWRKNLDFAAIQDIHSIKRQINAARGGGELALGGHNVKLGRGGIREIEFFAQTQQLIWGGREPDLRHAGTVDALDALAAAGKISGASAKDMIGAYRYLRRVEHFLQMLNDEQTQTLPEDEDELAAFAVFLGYADSGAFAAEFLETRACVEAHYAELFEDAPSLGAADAEGSAAGNLVFTGPDSDPDTIRTIASLGYENPETVDAAVRGWHHGRYRAMRSTRARELLTELMPRLLVALAKTPLPDDAFVRFDRFLAGLPAGVQLFAMFYARPELLDMVAEIIGTAPRLAEHLSRNPAVLESVLGADFFEAPPAPALLEEELDLLLGQARDFEDVLSYCRRWTNDRKFQVGVQSLGKRLQPRDAATALSNVADVVLGLLSSRVEDEFASQHGRVAGAGMLMVALGKLGGREMTPSSDLDIVFIYDAPDDAEASDGPVPLPPAQYFARLSQRLINAVTAPTSEGRLYEVDMRLRPSGSTGPIASSLQAFVRYHEDAAWTWEHMALTRARVITGPPALEAEVEKVIRDTLTRRRDPDKLLRDVAEMRQRMDDEHHTDVVWNVKHVPGGLVDVEFIAQYLQLRHAHRNPEVLSPTTRTALKRLGDAGRLDAAPAGQLIEALDLWQGLQGMLRLTLEGQARSAGADGIPAGLRDILAAVGGAADFTALTEKMRAVAERTHGLYDALIAAPAARRAADSPGQGLPR